MPQEIRVLCCFKCEVYQVDIVKKTNKWQCKLCGEKQSIFKEFFRGTGNECRLKVQELNLSKHVEKRREEDEILALLENDDLVIDNKIVVSEELSRNPPIPRESKWAKYMDNSKEKRSEFIQGVQCKNTKRKNESNSDTKDFKCSRNTFGTRSKWDAYL